MAETKEQHDERKLEELKGKNVAHYSVMLTAYVNARVDSNKAIFAFSSTGIGLLIATLDKLQNSCFLLKILYVGALAAFFLAACSTLLVYRSHTNSIEAYIRNEGKDQSMDFKLKSWKYVNYTSFAAGIALSLAFAITKIFGS